MSRKTDNFVDNVEKETTATININEFPKYTIQRIVEISDETIEKIADAVVRKLIDYKTEPQTDCRQCTEYGSYKCAKCDGEMYYKPQMERE